MVEVLKSKSMIGFFVFIVCISFVCTNNVQTFDDSYNTKIMLEN